MTPPEARLPALHPALLATRRWASPRVRAVATQRYGAGVSEAPFDRFNLGLRAAGDTPAAVSRNRAELAAIAGLPAPPHWLRQVHGIQVVRFGDAAAPAVVAATGSALIAGAEPEADAAVTAQAGVVLAVLTADCLPVVLAARDGGVVAVAHAGWRGLAAGVLEATVAAMGVAPGALQAWLGPAAGPRAYEVGAEVRAAFLEAASASAAPGTSATQASRASDDRHAGSPVPGADDPREHIDAVARAFVPTRPGHWLCDLYALARLRLAALGVADVEGGTRCTISEADAFFSHRRDGRSGRMATLAWIDPQP